MLYELISESYLTEANHDRHQNWDYPELSLSKAQMNYYKNQANIYKQAAQNGFEYPVGNGQVLSQPAHLKDQANEALNRANLIQQRRDEIASLIRSNRRSRDQYTDLARDGKGGSEEFARKANTYDNIARGISQTGYSVGEGHRLNYTKEGGNYNKNPDPKYKIAGIGIGQKPFADNIGFGGKTPKSVISEAPRKVSSYKPSSIDPKAPKTITIPQTGKIVSKSRGLKLN